MSVFYICGKPGGGKTYIGVKQICEELADPKSNRFIVTNIALKMPELAEWCHKHCQHEVNLSERIRILDDVETGEFWLYEPGREFQNRREIKMRRRTMDVPDFEDRAERGCLYVVDEVHVYFGARDWQATGGDATFFLSQHRKLNCDVVMITQHPEQTDKALRRLAQEYMSVRNLLREPILGFNLGTLFGAFRYVRTLNSPQSPNPAAFESGFVSLNPEEIGKLYDTTAGVGIAGRVAPPSSPKRGRHVAWLLLPIGIVVCLGIYGFKHIDTINKWLAHSMAHLFFHASDAVVPSVSVPRPLTLNNQPPVPANLTLNPSKMFGGIARTEQQNLPTVPPVAVSSTSDPEPPVYCTGFCVLGKNSMVFLSDGRTAHSADGDVQIIGTEKVEVFGSWFPVWSTAQIVKHHPEMVYHAMPTFDVQQVQPQESYSVPFAAPAVIVNPNHDYRDNLHNIKTSGFNHGADQSQQSSSASSQY